MKQHNKNLYNCTGDLWREEADNIADQSDGLGLLTRNALINGNQSAPSVDDAEAIGEAVLAFSRSISRQIRGYFGNGNQRKNGGDQ